MSVYIQVKPLVYKELQPMAKAAGCQVVLLDSATYQLWTNALERKMEALGISYSQYRSLVDAVEEHGCVAVLKSSQPLSKHEVAQHFSRVGLHEDDIALLSQPTAQAASAKKSYKSFCWFAVHVVNGDDAIVMESKGKMAAAQQCGRKEMEEEHGSR